MVQALPAPSLRELLSAAKLRECPSLLVTSQKFQSLYALVSKPLARRNHRGTLPQSALAGCQLPQGGSRDLAAPLNRVLAKTEGWRAIFIAPTELKSFLHSTTHRGTLPQSCVRSTAPSEREPGMGCAIQRAARKPWGCGRFSSPLRNSKVFYISPLIGGHSLSLAFARQLPQGGSRERLRGLVPFNRVLAKPQRCGRFSSPLRSSESFTFHHSTGYSLRRRGGGRFSSPLRKLGEFYISPFIGVVAKSEKRPSWGRWPLGGYFSRITGQVVLTALLM